jgi:pimeloyl-ACP methyl ester carboxylesterase
MEADPVIHRSTAPAGVELACRQVGEGRPLVLVHGFSSDSQQWIGHRGETRRADSGMTGHALEGSLRDRLA